MNKKDKPQKGQFDDNLTQNTWFLAGLGTETPKTQCKSFAKFLKYDNLVEHY